MDLHEAYYRAVVAMNKVAHEQPMEYLRRLMSGCRKATVVAAAYVVAIHEEDGDLSESEVEGMLSFVDFCRQVDLECTRLLFEAMRNKDAAKPPPRGFDMTSQGHLFIPFN